MNDNDERPRSDGMVTTVPRPVVECIASGRKPLSANFARSQTISTLIYGDTPQNDVQTGRLLSLRVAQAALLGCPT